MANLPRVVQRIHFEDFGGAEFERLVFAFHVRAGWSELAWFGQTGSDQGRDITGSEPIVGLPMRKTVIQCVNRSAISQKKAESDMSAAVAASGGTIESFKFVSRGTVSARRRDEIGIAATTLGVSHLTIWSGVEFEENLRLIGEDLLRRSCAGESFPDSGDELRRFADDFAGFSDTDILKQMAAVLDRPAFRTRFQEESSLPAFQCAVEDTIAALNTGVWRTREGDEIRRIPSLHHLRDPHAKAHISQAVQLIDRLRRAFVGGLRDRSIRPCGCGQSDCPVFMLDQRKVSELDHLRSLALDAFRKVDPTFTVRIA